MGAVIEPRTQAGVNIRFQINPNRAGSDQRIAIVGPLVAFHSRDEGARRPDCGQGVRKETLGVLRKVDSRQSVETVRIIGAGSERVKGELGRRPVIPALNGIAIARNGRGAAGTLPKGRKHTDVPPCPQPGNVRWQLKCRVRADL